MSLRLCWCVRSSAPQVCSVLWPNLAGDLLCPRIDVRPLAIVARVPAESPEQEPSPGRPAIKVDDARKDAIVTGVKLLFELADFPGFLLHQFADKCMSIAERSNAEQPQGFARQHVSVSAHEFSRFSRP